MSFPHGVISVFLYFCVYVHVLLLANLFDVENLTRVLL